MRLASAEGVAAIHYTTDGTIPDQNSPRYNTPFTIESSTTLKAVAFQGDSLSPVITVGFRQLSDFPKIRLSAPYAPQYAAAGTDTLIDGLRGNNSFKTGRWQGYLGKDLDVTLDFGEARDIKQVTVGYLQDVGSWIF